MVEPLGLGSGEHEVKLGSSFDPGSGTGFHSIRYDFKPASVDTKRMASLNIAEGNSVNVTVPHIEGSGTTHTVYKGNKRPIQKECVLIIDHQTGEITLEKLSNAIQLKKTRQPPALENKRAEPVSNRTGCEESRAGQQLINGENQKERGEIKDIFSRGFTTQTSRKSTTTRECNEKEMQINEVRVLSSRDTCNNSTKRKREKSDKNAKVRQKDREDSGLKLRNVNVNEIEMPGKDKRNISQSQFVNGLIRENSDELPDIADVKLEMIMVKKVLPESSHLGINVTESSCNLKNKRSSTSGKSSPSQQYQSRKKRQQKQDTQTRNKRKETALKSQTNGKILKTKASPCKQSIDIVQFARTIGNDIARFLKDHDLTATRRPYVSTTCSLSEFKHTHHELYERARKRAALPEDVLNELINFLCRVYRESLVSSEQLLAHVQRLEDVCDYVISRMEEQKSGKEEGGELLGQGVTASKCRS